MSWLDYLAIFLGSLALSATLVWVSIRLAHRFGVLDHPDRARKLQATPIPRLGGLAVAIGFSIASSITIITLGQASDLRLLWTILLPALGFAVLGFVDDRRDINPWLRLGIQGLLALLVWQLGTRITISDIPAVDLVIFVIWVMAVVNGINLLDNSDGLAASTAAVSAAAAAVIAIVSGQVLVGALGVALAGAALGFLWHNWFPARVYLGDAGAYFLGFMLAVLAVRLRPESLSTPWTFLIPVLLLALPLVDTAVVVFGRLRQGLHPFTAGRDHLSHRLQARGLSVPRSVLILQATLALACVAAVWMTVAASND
jgi:UDP-GlcNAc:undecaprenyl-phosphate GlcNAc-1-phosphate transferase